VTEATLHTGGAAANNRIPGPALLLGVAGLIPFVGCAVLLWTADSPDRFNTAHALVAYGAVILSFLGGINWGIALKEQSTGDLLHRLGWSVVPSLVGWLGLLLQALVNHGVALGLLLVAFIAQYFLDRRSVLTTGAVLSLAAGLLRVVTG